MADFSLAETPILFGTRIERDVIIPADSFSVPDARLIMLEIPIDFQALKAKDKSLALAWRMITRDAFQAAFAAGYLVTDAVHDRAKCFYILAHGEAVI
jgi:predicted GNAT superfamily acetyltransferase